MIELDGSCGEGGGALVRVALALSTLTGQPFHIDNIRSGRKDPGLKAQHLSAITALQQLSKATCTPVELGSTSFSFTPGAIESGIYTIDIGTAGSITLLLQALILPCLFAPGKITLKIKGGTCGKWQASVDYLQHLLLPQLRRFAEQIELKILRRGYYPQGQGEILLEIWPKFKQKQYPSPAEFLAMLQLEISPINLTEQGKLEHIRGMIDLSKDLAEQDVAERIKKAAEYKLKNLCVPVHIRTEYAQSACAGGQILLWGVFTNLGEVDARNPVLLGASVLLEKNKSSEHIGQEAASLLMKEIDSEIAVDSYLQDQLIPFMALLPHSCIKVGVVTEHSKANFYVAEKFLDVVFTVDGNIIKSEAL